MSSLTKPEILALGILSGSVLGVLIANAWGERYARHQVVRQVLPKRLHQRHKKKMPFDYHTVVVKDEQGKALYRGNFLTLWAYPGYVVALGRHGLELWKKDSAENDINTALVPRLSRDDSLLIPFHVLPPICDVVDDVDVRDWSGKLHVAAPLEDGTWKVETLKSGAQLEVQSDKQLRFVDADGVHRIAELED